MGRDDVVMVAHAGIGTEVDGEDRTQKFDAINDPLAAVREVKTGCCIGATQKGPAHATGDAVVIRCVFQGNLAVSGFRHEASLEGNDKLQTRRNCTISCRIFSEWWVSWLSRSGITNLLGF